MGHDHHAHPPDATTGLRVALALNLTFACIEFAGGWWTNSVAVLADAVHDLGDAAALGLAWQLQRMAGKPADEHYSFGYGRLSLLGGLLTAAILVAGTLAVATEAVPRLWHPEPANAPGMLALAVLGVIVNGAAALKLRAGRTINERVAAWHLVEDLLGWIAVLIAAAVMCVVEVPLLDPLLAVAIALWVLVHAIGHGRHAARLFLQGVPDGASLEAIERDLAATDGVVAVHHTHLWSLDGAHNVLTAHVVLAQTDDVAEIRAVKQRLRQVTAELGLAHSTIELELGEGDCSLHPDP